MMSILEIFHRKRSAPKPLAQYGEATIMRKQPDTRTSIIGVAVRLEDEAGDASDEDWYELWDELHHQGDLWRHWGHVLSFDSAEEPDLIKNEQ
jgi:hypothetical protein